MAAKRVHKSPANKTRKKLASEQSPSTSVSSDSGEASTSDSGLSQSEGEEQRSHLDNNDDQGGASAAEGKEDSAILENPAVEGEEPEDSLLIRPLTQKERETLAKRLNPVEMEALIKQFRTDDEIVRLGEMYGKLIKCSVHISTAMATVLFQVPEYETVKFVKRRLVKYGLGKGVFLSSIDRIYLEVQADSETGIEKLIMPENDSNMLEVFLYNLGFRAGNQYKIRIAFKSNKADQAAEQDMIEEARKRDHPNAITNLPLSDQPMVRMYQEVLQYTLPDTVEYNVLGSTKTIDSPKPSEVKEKSTSRSAARYGDKWTQERLNVFIDAVVNSNPDLTVSSIGKTLIEKQSTLFPERQKGDGKESKKFTATDFKDKWINIVGGKDNKRGYFDRKSAKCNREKLSQSRKVILEEQQIQMIEEYLKKQPEYEKPGNPQ